MVKLSRPYAHGRPFLNTRIHLTFRPATELFASVLKQLTIKSSAIVISNW